VLCRETGAANFSVSLVSYPVSAADQSYDPNAALPWALEVRAGADAEGGASAMQGADHVGDAGQQSAHGQAVRALQHAIAARRPRARYALQTNKGLR
jgi:hypothetical protein